MRYLHITHRHLQHLAVGESPEVRTRFGRSLGIGLAAALTGSLLTAAPASADEPVADSNEVSSLVLELTPQSETIDSDEIATPTLGNAGDILIENAAGDVSALLPSDGGGEVISVTGVSIGLPAEASTSDAEITTDGVVSYAGEEEGDASVAIVATGERTRILTVIPDVAAPTEYTYPVSDATPVLREDGSVDLLGLSATWGPDGTLTTTSDSLLGRIATPWATDATGKSVPTHFEIRGGSVVQVIDVDETTAFPVVADPDVWWWIGTAATCAAQVAALIVAWAKLPTIIAKANKIIKSSSKLTAAVNKLGGLKKAIEAIKQYVANKSKLTSTQRGAVAALGTYGVAMFSDLLGIGSCVALIRGS